MEKFEIEGKENIFVGAEEKEKIYKKYFDANELIKQVLVLHLNI